MTTQENLTRLILEMSHDTLDGLSLRVEELARKLLFEIFEWREANFEYDPTYRVQPILRIGLTLRGQALAFQGVKQLDDTHRLSRKERRETWEAADAWVLPFLPDGIEEHFWEALERMGTTIDPPEARGHSARFREFARRLRERLDPQLPDAPGPRRHGGAAARALEAKPPLDPSAIVPIAALDQYLTLDLLILANSLSVDRENSVGTVPGRDRAHRPARRHGPDRPPLLARLPGAPRERPRRAGRAAREPRRGRRGRPVRRALRHHAASAATRWGCSTASATRTSSRSSAR